MPIIEIKGTVTVIGRIFDTGNMAIAGIASGAAYASGDAMGVPQSMKVPKSGRIETIVITDMDKEELAFDIAFFQDFITPTADNSAFDLLDADRDKVQGHVSITNADFASFNDNSVGTYTNVGYSYTAPTGLLVFQLITRGVPNYTASDDLAIRFVIYDYDPESE